MGENKSRKRTFEGRKIASKRLKRLVEGLKLLLGEEEALRLMSDRLLSEEILNASKRYKLNEIDEAIEDAVSSGASRWAWVSKRLKSGHRNETK
ncbi:MAG: hypothetical protein AUJ18_03760 [Candidatus Hydrogenedentes bacterium CG1_02_42_14]|nr:MAG: hypothetical protein AUJ18_03760 [Candidatus Hydrogenedentes bacterium CG1_02_42_14]